MTFKITGWGMYLPPYIETSEDLAFRIKKSANWIIEKTGVKERRVSEIDVDEMGAQAAREAIGSKPNPDLIINASGVPKQVIPDTSVFIQKKLSLTGIPSFSVHSTCLSFMVALNIAANFINSNQYKRILIVSSDRGTIGRNYNEPESAALLGDAAAAVYIESADDHSGMVNYSMETFPEGAQHTEVRGGGTALHPENPKTTYTDNLFTMNGPKVYRMAFQKIYSRIKKDLSILNIKQRDIDLVIPHQASGKAIEAYSKYGGFEKEQVLNILLNTGNCVAASLPLGLVTAYKNKSIKNGSVVYMIGTGAGLSIASAIIKI